MGFSKLEIWGGFGHFWSPENRFATYLLSNLTPFWTYFGPFWTFFTFENMTFWRVLDISTLNQVTIHFGPPIWTPIWTPFGPLLDHFWTGFVIFPLNLIVDPSEHPQKTPIWTGFGQVLDRF